MLLQVACNSLEERFVAQVITKHSNDGAAFEITDMVEDLIDLESIPNRDFNRMRGAKRIELKSCFNGFSLIAVNQ